MEQIPHKESLTVEFKSDKAKLSDNVLVEAVVGLANTEGGALFVGVEDNGEISGIVPEHLDEKKLTAIIANKTRPSLYVQTEILRVNTLDVLKIIVPKSQAIIATADGKALKRRLKIDGTPENVPMYPYEFNTKLSELSLLDFSAQVILEANIEDLDSNERVRLREMIKLRKGESSLLELSDEELDKALRLVKEYEGKLRPTVAGLLLIGKENRIRELIPTAESCFQVLEGTQIRLNEHFFKPLLATFEIFEKNMKAWNPERELDYGLVRVAIPEFAEQAFREGLVNAFCHRDYSMLGPVRLAINDEGLTISNPGGFIEGVNLHNLLTVEPRGRNPVLADSLKRIGLAERTGRGIDRIFEGSIIYGRPQPDYSESTDQYVKLFIPRAAPDLAFAKMIFDEEKRLGRALPINSLLILSILQTQRRISLTELAHKIHISEPRTQASVERLIESGLVEAIGNEKSRSYMLSANVYKRQNNMIGYVRQATSNTLNYEELVKNLAIEQQGYISRNDIKHLLHLNDNQAYYLLRKLTEKGLFSLEKKGRSAKYKWINPK